jgi:hypothetical protein
MAKETTSAYEIEPIANEDQLNAKLAKNRTIVLYDGVNHIRDYTHDYHGVSWKVDSGWNGASGVWNCRTSYYNIGLDHRNRIVIRDYNQVQMS